MIFNDGFFTTEKLSAHKEMTPEGYLLCKDVVISRVGEFDYLSDEVEVPSSTGRVKVTRSAEELFKPDAMASFEGKPVTIGHQGFVTPENHNALAVGTVANVRREGDNLVADLLITSQEGIDIIESGALEEISCGYDARTVPDGDGVGHQEGIVGNHVAIVETARCGSTCKIKDGFMADEKQSLLEKLLDLFQKGDEEGFVKAVEEAMPESDEEPQDIAQKEPEVKEDPEPKADEEPEQGAESVEERMNRLEARLEEIAAKLEERQEDECKDACKDEDVVAEEEVEAVLADADELCEGMRKPIGDAKDGRFTQDGLDRVKRTALKGSGIDAFGDVDDLEGKALSMAFKGAVALKRSNKNPSVHVNDGARSAYKSVNDINNEFWGK